MATIQVVLDKPLLKAADRMARKAKVNRSALIREALREYLRKKQRDELIEQDRRGYLAHPDSVEEAEAWARIAAWPEE